MGKISYSEIFEKAVEKTNAMCCPACESIGGLRYADHAVLVSANIQLMRQIYSRSGKRNLKMIWDFTMIVWKNEVLSEFKSFL